MGSARATIARLVAKFAPASRMRGVAMRVRKALVSDAAAMGRVMVEAWLAGHHGQMPEAAWEKRRDEWKPEESAAGWERNLRELDADPRLREVYLVAVDEDDTIIGLVMGSPADDDESGQIAEISALYVLPDRHGQGLGRLLLKGAADELSRAGFTSLHIAVLTANLPARAFYEAMGGRDIGERIFDEDGVMLDERVYAWPDFRCLTT
jgi:GNAT superfamily N-acetyltransferase